MATSAHNPPLSHIERTAAEPRGAELYEAVVGQVEAINNSVRLVRLDLPRHEMQFLPGQWLDVHVPGIPRPGGFTITSPPHKARHFAAQRSSPFVELAIQRSPGNPPAAWLWRPEEEIVGARLSVRVGGRFVWPPPGLDLARVRRVVFVAGGVGVNPLICMLAHLEATNEMPKSVRFLYSTKVEGPVWNPKSILFLPCLQDILDTGNQKDRLLDLFITGKSSPSAGGPGPGPDPISMQGLRFHKRRLTHADLLEALGPAERRSGVVCYICGPPTMTDELVAVAQTAEGMAEDLVLCEKWW